MYSIKATSQATGLSVETLRAWERRYGIVIPRRDESGRRVYGPEDVLRLRRLREATDRGHPIGRLAALTDERLANLLAEPPPSGAASSVTDAFVTRMLEATRDFDADAFDRALVLAIALLEPRRLATEVLHPLLLEIGDRWHRGEFAISQERLASGTVRQRLSLVLDTFRAGARRETILLATLPGERHELGLLMAAVTCAGRGFRVRYLGPDLPAEEIARFAREIDAAVVGLSLVRLDLLAGLPQQLRALDAALAPDVTVWLGGVATDHLPGGVLPARCVVIGDVVELERRLDLLAA